MYILYIYMYSCSLSHAPPAGRGVLLLAGPLAPSPAPFHAARRKAQALFGIQGAEDAVLLRWVTAEDFADAPRAFDRWAALLAVGTAVVVAAGSAALCWAFRARDLVLP